MKTPVILTSPLAGTAAVAIALGLMAVPLLRLTSVSAPAKPVTVGSLPAVDTHLTPAVLRLKLLAPARKVQIGTPGLPPMLNLTDIQAGDSEYDTKLPLDHGICELEVLVDFGGPPAETAVFLTAMPNNLEDRTLFLTGSGELHDIMRFEWPHTLD